MTAPVVRQVVGYGFAVLANGAALLLWQTLTRHVGPGLPPLLTYYPAVMLTATLYGLGPGLLATLLSALLAAYFVFPPEGFAAEGAVDLLGLGIFSVMGVGMSLVAERYHRAQDRATTYAQELAVQTAEARAATAAAQAIQAREQALQASEQRYRDLNATLEQRVTDRTAALRQLTGALATAEQRERQRLGQLLHDGLQQYLVAARLRLELLDRAHSSALAREVDALLSEALKASRALTAELSPPILHSGGFVPALRWLAQWMQDTHRLTVTVNADERFAIPHEAARVLLFQAVRELLFNIVKHADIPHAAVAVHAEGGRARIVVVDHGKGFDPERMQDTGGIGLGLPTIRQRLEYLGGRLEITSASGQGSRFTLTVPLRPVP